MSHGKSSIRPFFPSEPLHRCSWHFTGVGVLYITYSAFVRLALELIQVYTARRDCVSTSPLVFKGERADERIDRLTDE